MRPTPLARLRLTRHGSCHDGSPMTPASEEQRRIRDAIERLCAGFGDAYWLERDRQGGLPEEFYAAVARDGWLRIALPQEDGGAGLGIAAAPPPAHAVAQARRP